jgi:acylphosphatase
MRGQRRTVLFTGTVQGVGFRWQTVRALKGLAVTGYVRNRADGPVELVVEGSPDATREAIERILAVLAHRIRSRDESISEATGEFAGFEIRR